MRRLKREIIERLLTTELDHSELIAAVLRTDRLIDIAFEEMSEAYVHSHESGVRAEEAYRMYAAGQNLSLEREKQLGALLEWENRLFRTVATDLPLDEIPHLNDCTFGLWLHHKAPLIFDETRELAAIDQSMQRIDNTLIPQFALLHNDKTHFEAVRALFKSITTEVEQLKYLLSTMFERLTDMEVGRDVLTQLFNRRFLQTIMKREIDLHRRQKIPFCILMIDVDFFKRVNDTHGHESGDRVLQGIASLLINQVRASDFVFRYGGEEFLVVLAELDQTQAETVAEKIRSRVEAANIALADNHNVKVTLSIGVAAFDGHPDYQRLVDRADKALFAAKHAVRNCWVTAQD